MLVEYFVRRYARRAGKNFRSIDKKTLNLLQNYDWPGNIRELQNVIERSVILNSGEVFAVDESWLSKQPNPGRPEVVSSAQSQGKPRSEREIIEAALAASRGRVAGRLGAARGWAFHHPRLTIASRRCISTGRDLSFADIPTTFTTFTTFTISARFAAR